MIHLSLPIRRFPLQYHSTVLPNGTTRLPLSPYCNPVFAPLGQPRCFPPQTCPPPILFCRCGFKRHEQPGSGQNRIAGYPLFATPTQGRLRLHTAFQGGSPFTPHCRFKSASYTGRYHKGVRLCTRAGLHEDRDGVSMPLEIALNSQVQKSALSPSTHPKLGVSSKHQRFHRCAL